MFNYFKIELIGSRTISSQLHQLTNLTGCKTSVLHRIPWVTSSLGRCPKSLCNPVAERTGKKWLLGRPNTHLWEAVLPLFKLPLPNPPIYCMSTYKCRTAVAKRPKTAAGFAMAMKRRPKKVSFNSLAHCLQT